MKLKDHLNQEIESCDNEVLYPDYAKWLDEQKPAWEDLDKDEPERKRLEKILNECF